MTIKIRDNFLYRTDQAQERPQTPDINWIQEHALKIISLNLPENWNHERTTDEVEMQPRKSAFRCNFLRIDNRTKEKWNSQDLRSYQIEIV